jgi:hypothetical protein
MFGYTEPFRRFVQHETFSPQANEIPNQAASWLPGDDYYVNFHEGDPFIKVDEGYARLPGAGYEALHPELQGLNPEDYPDIHKMSILADVAPYSREYHTYRQKVGSQAQGNTELEIEYEKILTRVKKTRESVIKMNDRHFTAPVDEISGTVDEVSAGGITLNEYPGRRFQFSSVSTSAADMSARILGENNNMTGSEVAAEVDARRGALQEYLSSTFTSGDTARLVIPKGAAAAAEQIRAVVLADGENVNRELIDRGYGEYREDLGGAEARAMHGVVGRHLGSMAEGLAFQGDSGPLNPMRYQGSPSCRTQRTSHARQAEAHSMGRMILLCSLTPGDGKTSSNALSVLPNPKNLARARRKPSSHSPLHHPPGIPVALNKSTGCCQHFRLAKPKPTLPSQKPAPFPSSENSQIRPQSGHRSWWPNLQPKRRGYRDFPMSIATYDVKEWVLGGFFPA